MVCVKCGKEIVPGAAFCPHCGEKITQEDSGPEKPVYQADVKRPLRPGGKLIVYRDRTEYATSSVQKTVFNYAGLVAVRKGKLDSIEFITEGGRVETCPADRKCVHEAFLYIEQAVRPFLAQRKEQLLSQGVRYSFLSSQGLLNDGVLDLSAEQAVFRAKSGKSDVIAYKDVKSVGAPGGTLNFTLYGGAVKSFSISKELRDEVTAYVADAIAPYLARRKEALLAQGIYFSSVDLSGGTLDVLDDRLERKNQAGQVQLVIPYPNIRSAGFSNGMLELALTNGTVMSFPVEADLGNDVLAFVKNAIEPYVTARTVGFKIAFGTDEQIEFNEERGVFHILRQNGREVSKEWPIEALVQCAWTENKEMSALGSVVSGGITLFKSAAKAAGTRTDGDGEERVSKAGVALTVRGEQDTQPLTVWFGIFSTGISRTSKKFEPYFKEWSNLADYLMSHCPDCELIEPVLPVIPEPENDVPEAAEMEALPESTEAAPAATPEPVAVEQEPVKEASTAAQQDDLGIAKYIEGVSRFIGNCATPMTIAFQGNRVSRGSSILKMLFDRLEAQYGSSPLWINARQIPQSEGGEELSVLVGKRLVGLLSGESGSAKQTENLLTNLAAFVSGTVAGDSSIGKDMVGGLLNRNSADSLEDLVKAFSKRVNAREGKTVLFIDGLDLLAPARAVELLEAARDFFDCKGCVFIIAADYAHILSGAQELYDESKAKGFFDGLFKMSFRVPASSYNMESYVKSKVEGLGIQVEDEKETSLYGALVQSSVGKDTESIDRLFVSFQLLQDLTGEDVYASRYKRLALFALLCMQTTFRDAYDYAIKMKDCVTPEFLAGLCGEAAQPWDREQAEEEAAAYRSFGRVLAEVVNLDGETGISETECRAFAEVLELSSVTYR